jgi:hypothetical protein
VADALAGVLVSMLNNGQVGLAIPAVLMAAAVCWLIVRRRRRVYRAAGVR